KEYPRFALHRTILQNIFHPRRLFGPPQKTDWRQVKAFMSDNMKLNIFASSKLIQADYDEDKKKLIEFYNSKGYRDAEIVSDTIFSHDARTVDVGFVIYEGPKYYFRNIIWTGNYIYPDKVLNSVLAISKGD